MKTIRTVLDVLRGLFAKGPDGFPPHVGEPLPPAPSPGGPWPSDPEPWTPGTRPCGRPPVGWVCTAGEGHDGPCPAWPIHELVDDASQFPHCDSEILHKPGECRYCDVHPAWQERRLRAGVRFSGETPDAYPYPTVACPSESWRTAETAAAWPGNRPYAEGEQVPHY